MKLYEHASSGNCLKVRLALRHLDLPYESVSVDLFRGETRTDEHFARNPDGRIPVLETGDGELIPESAAILLFLAEGTPLLPPPGTIERTRVHQWMFFEQNRIEADLAVARFLKLAGRDVTMPEVFANRLERGRDALAALDRGLAGGGPFLAGDFSVADIALYGYGHCGADAGADPRDFEHVAAWLDRVEATPGFVNDLTPVPPWINERPL
jgi:glutathione S-transferase